jgi:L-ascorbate metabolism protein UlaG (beta-lactamase superfamily)
MFKILGSSPAGARLSRIQQSPNYYNASFQNLTPTEVMLKSASMVKMMKDFINKPADNAPSSPLPSIKTNLLSLDDDKPVIVWFGHSSYFIQCRGLRILVDPVFSNNASPVSFFAKAFAGTNVYSADEFPSLDIILITHDHYDHLDYTSIKQLANKTTMFITSLGVGAHLASWGIDECKIVELDWWEQTIIKKEVELTATPARHFSGRVFKRGQTLWSSFVLQLYGHNIFIGADSGYDQHFKTIAAKFGRFDIAILETGQYGVNWPLIHTTPEEAVQVATDLQASVILPVHWGKFALALHPWSEPIERVLAAAQNTHLTITTPIIGEPVIVNHTYPSSRWWRGIK